MVEQFSVNQIISERYQVVSLIGEGGMGLVYKVVQIFLGKEYAFKTIKKAMLSDIVVRRFQQEARAASALKHENIIGVIDFGLLEDNTPFLVMEYVKGEALGDWLRRSGRLSVEQALPIFIQVCNGLAFAHKNGVVHRDIKPNNIMIVAGRTEQDAPRVKIVDFGIAKIAGHEEGEIQALTRTGEIFGSPLYMSPEQCLGTRIDFRSDIYSLGCVFFECLTGLPPFVGDNALSTMMKHQGETHSTLSAASLGLKFPKALEDIIRRMLAKAPEARYQTMDEVAADLQTLQTGGKISREVQSSSATVNSDSQSVTLSKGKLLFALAGVVVTSMAVGAFLMSAFQPHKVESKAQAVQVATTTASSAVEEDPHHLSISTIPSEFEGAMLTDKELDERIAHPKQKYWVHISNRTVNNHAMERIALAPGVKSVGLSGCRIETPGLAYLVKVPTIMELNFSSSDLNDSGAKIICSSKGLVFLNISGTEVTDVGARQLMKISTLKGFAANHLQISDEATSSPSPGLQNISLKEDKKITNATIANLSRLHLKGLELDGTSVNDDGIKSMTSADTLEYIALTDSQVTAAGIRAMCQSHQKLRRVDVMQNSLISVHDIASLRAEFPRTEFKMEGRRNELDE